MDIGGQPAVPKSLLICPMAIDKTFTLSLTQFPYL